MDYIFLPERIKKAIQEQTGRSDEPLAVVRSSGSIDGQSGEGYILGYPDSVLAFSKTFGDSEFACLGGVMGQGVTDFLVKKEKYNIFLNMTLQGQAYNIKVSSLEESDCNKIQDVWNAFVPGSAPAAQMPPPIPTQDSAATSANLPPVQAETVQAETAEAKLRIASQLPPLVGLGAALMFVATVDDEIDQLEDDYIRRTLADNQAVLQKSLDFYKDHTFEELLGSLHLDQQQKLCIFANMNEIAMSDGVLHSVEQRILKQFATYMGITDDEFQAIRDVLLIKNQISVLVDE